MRTLIGKWFLTLSVVLIGAGSAQADVLFSGTVYYTRYFGLPNVWSVDYDYNETTQSLSLSNNTSIASLPGADGIIFAPNGHLLVGGAGYPAVQEITTAGAPVIDHGTGGQPSFHLALSPDGTKVYTSNFSGPLVTVTLAGGVVVSPVIGDDTSVTQLAFANGKTFYATGGPNGGGNAGLYDLATNTTSKTVTGEDAVHGMVYDSYSDKITFFGRGWVGTMDATDGTGYKEAYLGFPDFDQGATDGKGHAFIADPTGGGLVFVDYHTLGDITAPEYAIELFSASGISFAGIDDVAPLSGLGSQVVPEPSTFALLGLGGLGFVVRAYRRRRAVQV